MQTLYSYYGDSPLIAFLCIAYGLMSAFMGAVMHASPAPRWWLALTGLAIIAAFPLYTVLTRYVFA